MGPFFPSNSSLKPISIPVILVSSAILFAILPFLTSSLSSDDHPYRRLLSSPPASPQVSCSTVLRLPPDDRCAFSRSRCSPSGGLLNYSSIHFCFLHFSPLLSFPSLSLLLILLFYLLARTASDRFSPAVSLLSSRLHLSPSMAAVTLLALGNGAPDLFASVAALHTGQIRTGLAAVISAGSFVSAFVVGAVVVLSHASPVSLEPSPFIRDVFFYILAVSAMFYIYLSAEIFLWQAAGLIALYFFFVGLVFWMDCNTAGSEEAGEEMIKLPEWESRETAANGEACRPNSSGAVFCGQIRKGDLVSTAFVFHY